MPEGRGLVYLMTGSLGYTSYIYFTTYSPAYRGSPVSAFIILNFLGLRFRSAL